MFREYHFLVSFVTKAFKWLLITKAINDFDDEIDWQGFVASLVIFYTSVMSLEHLRLDMYTNM